MKAFILVKLVYSELIWIKPIYLKIWRNVNLDQEQKKIRIKKRNTFDSVSVFYEGGELTLSAFTSGIFPIKKQWKGLKVLNLAQVKTDETSENLLKWSHRNYTFFVSSKRNY